MIPCSSESLIKFLKAHKHEASLQSETDQVYVIFNVDGQDFPLFFRIYEGEDLLQLLTFFPLQVQSNRFDPIARMLHLLNKEIDLPGFGIDEGVGLVFHRIMIPIFNKKIDTHLLESYLDAIPKLCQQFYAPIAGTAMMDISFEEILKKSQSK